MRVENLDGREPMCGRFALPPGAIVRLEEETGGRWRGPVPEPCYNIGPRTPAPVLRVDEGERVLELFRWGLIPAWAKDAAIGDRCFNARAEGVHEKPAFRGAFRRRRCLVPLAGFYEWQKVPGLGRKQPWWIHAADGGVLRVAGLWEEWRPARDVEAVRTFAIVTTEPNGFMRGLHHRMPVVLEGDAGDAWLDPNASVESLRELTAPCSDAYLTGYPVSTRVNVPTADGPELLEPVTEGDGTSSR